MKFLQTSFKASSASSENEASVETAKELKLNLITRNTKFRLLIKLFTSSAATSSASAATSALSAVATTFTASCSWWSIVVSALVFKGGVSEGHVKNLGLACRALVFVGGLAVLHGTEVAVDAEHLVLLLLQAREVGLSRTGAFLLSEHVAVGSALRSLGEELLHGEGHCAG